jgi:hypothetical protein
MPDSDKLWEFLLGLEEPSRKALFAHCASLSLNAVVEPWNKRPGALAHADELAATLGFDMVEAGWSPTVDNYLGRVTKARIVQAVREARGEDSAQLIDHMKKDLMAREAARLLEGSNWLPEPLRLEGDDAVGEGAEAVAHDVTDETALDGETAELPAYLADDTGVPDEPVSVAGADPTTFSRRVIGLPHRTGPGISAGPFSFPTWRHIMSAHTIYDCASLGASSATRRHPKPPSAIHEEARRWERRNGTGRLVKKEPPRSRATALAGLFYPA